MTKQILPNRWLIWAIVAIVVIGVGVWGYIQYATIQDNTAKNISMVPTAKTTRSENTTGWQTYQNEEYGFEFKYPSTFLLKKVPEYMYSVEGSKEIIAITNKKQDFQYILTVLPYKDVEISVPSNWSGNSFVYDPEKKDWVIKNLKGEILRNVDSNISFVYDSEKKEWIIKNLEDDSNQDIYIDKTNSGLKIYVLYSQYGDAGANVSIGIIPLPNDIALQLDFSGYKFEAIKPILYTFEFIEPNKSSE